MGERIDKAKGKAKQAAGDLTDDSSLKREGEVDEHSGKLKGSVNDAKQKIDDAIDSVKDSVKDRTR